MQNFHSRSNKELCPITSICVVEKLQNCPLDYDEISGTDCDYQNDHVKDYIWETKISGQQVKRYICFSKSTSEGKPEHVVESIRILNNEELPPQGFIHINQTLDTSQKPFQNKQLCYKIGHSKVNNESIAQILLLDKSATPTDEFEHIGEINGVQFWVKKIPAIARKSNSPDNSFNLFTPGLSTNMLPNSDLMQKTMEMGCKMMDMDFGLNPRTQSGNGNGITSTETNNLKSKGNFSGLEFGNGNGINRTTKTNVQNEIDLSVFQAKINDQMNQAIAEANLSFDKLSNINLNPNPKRDDPPYHYEKQQVPNVRPKGANVQNSETKQQDTRLEEHILHEIALILASEWTVVKNKSSIFFKLGLRSGVLTELENCYGTNSKDFFIHALLQYSEKDNAKIDAIIEALKSLDLCTTAKNIEALKNKKL